MSRHDDHCDAAGDLMNDQRLTTERWLHVVQDAADLGLWSWDVVADRVRWSPRTADMFGIPQAQAPTTMAEYAQALHPDDRDAVAGAVQRAMATGQERFRVVHRVLLPGGGGVRWLEGFGSIEREHGAPVLLAGTVADVSERMRVEQALRTSEARLHAATDSMPFAFWMRDRSGVCLAQNRLSRELYGDQIGKSPEAMGLPADQAALVRQVLDAALAGQTIDQTYVRRSPQGERSFRAIIAPVTLDENAAHAQIIGVVGIDIETTEARRLEAELIQAAREESIGRAASGIAHDLNNLLTAMLGFSERAVLQIGQGDRDSALTSLQRVRDTTMRGSSFVRHLLAFARRDQPRIEVIDLHLILDGMRALLAMTLGDHIRIELQPQAPTALVRADRSRIEQVLLNLAVNSRDAITNDVVTHGGWFRIATAVQDYTVLEAAAMGLLGSGRYLCLHVQDSGPGIPPELCARVFEPFFTTKPAGRGTGLGLSLCRRIVRDAGGDIAMQPSDGGAHIVIYLPLATLT